MSLDELLTAIEATNGKECFTVLMSAACACMHRVLDEMPDRGEELGDVDMGFRVLVLADQPRVDLLIGDRSMPVCVVPTAYRDRLKK